MLSWLIEKMKSQLHKTEISNAVNSVSKHTHDEIDSKPMSAIEEINDEQMHQIDVKQWRDAHVLQKELMHNNDLHHIAVPISLIDHAIEILEFEMNEYGWRPQHLSKLAAYFRNYKSRGCIV